MYNHKSIVQSLNTIFYHFVIQTHMSRISLFSSFSLGYAWYTWDWCTFSIGSSSCLKIRCQCYSHTHTFMIYGLSAYPFTKSSQNVSSQRYACYEHKHRSFAIIIIHNTYYFICFDSFSMSSITKHLKHRPDTTKHTLKCPIQSWTARQTFRYLSCYFRKLNNMWSVFHAYSVTLH